MADNDDEVNPPVVVDGQENPNERDDDVDDDGEEDDDDEEEEVLDDAARAAALLKAETETLARIATAKSLVKLTKKVLQRQRKDVSPIWKKWFFIPEVIDPTQEAELQGLDNEAYGMILESRKPGVFMFCCKLCFDTPKTSLHACFKKNSNNKGPGNLPNHLAALHIDAWEEYSGKQSTKKRSIASDKSDTGTPSKRNRQESSQISTSASASKSKRTVYSPPLAAIATEVSVASSLTNSFSHYDLPDLPNTKCHSSHFQAGTKQLVEEFKILCHDFITFNNIPVRAGTSHHDCPEFKKMIMFAMTHGPQIRKQENLIMATKQFNNFRKN
jgi:hypothetical protein